MYFNDFNPVFVIVFLVLWYVLQGTAYFKFFEKAGQAGWKGFVPLYNYFIHLQIIGRPLWWIVLLFVPVINFFVALTMHLVLLKSFGRYTYLDQVLGVVLAPIYMNYVAWSNTTYIDKAPPSLSLKNHLVKNGSKPSFLQSFVPPSFVGSLWKPT